ncbi:restriction endonuclease subunit S, partial [bacterium]|nr:restriction endonuclease subunit S [bacterium]
LLPKDTIVITARGTVGAMAMLEKPMCFNQTCYGLTAKEGTDQTYLYFALKGAISNIHSVSYGTVFNTITMLEAMARAIFKSWFVDFDPVYAKMEGREVPLPAEVMDLFPAELVESELGMIPKGWEITTIGNVYKFAYGKSLTQKRRIPGKYSVYGSNGMVGTHNEALVKGPGVVIGRKGNPGIVTWAANDFFPIDTTFYLQTSKPLLFAFYQLEFLDLPRLSADSAVPGLNRNIAYLEEIILPNEDILKEYEKIVASLYIKINLNNNENVTLVTMRDILLPTLMSGRFI